jgi:hypothetical protein
MASQAFVSTRPVFPHSLSAQKGTAITKRQVADEEIQREHRSLIRAEQFAGKGDPDLIRRNIDEWLDYRADTCEGGPDSN